MSEQFSVLIINTVVCSNCFKLGGNTKVVLADRFLSTQLI